MKFFNIRLSVVVATAMMLSGCGSQLVRSEGDTNPFCALVGAGVGGGTAAAIGAAAGPIGLGVVVGAMLGSLVCPDQAPTPVATTDYIAPAKPPPEPAPLMVEVIDSDGDGIADADDQCPDTPPGTRVDSRGCPKLLLTLTGLNFKFDSSAIEPDSVAILDKAVAALNRNATVDVRIEGHTDSVGTEAYNLKLSQRRADAVLDYLVRHGITAQRLITLGKGEVQPFVPNDTAEGRYLNRRVEFHVVGTAGDLTATQ